jgi:hypothetical protein
MALMAALAALAQMVTVKGPAEYFYGSFREGAALVCRRAGLMPGPEDSSDTLEILAPGTSVVVSGPPEGSLIRNGAGTAWYPVVTGRHRGWIAGTEMAMAYIALDDGTLIACALTDRSGDPCAEFHGALLALDGSGAVLDSLTMELPYLLHETPTDGAYGYRVFFREACTDGLEGIPHGAFLCFEYGACGYENRNQLVFWDGGRLITGPRASIVSEAGVFHWSQTLVLPCEEGGRPGSILLVEVSEQFSDLEWAYYETSRDTTVIEWDGAGFRDLL